MLFLCLVVLLQPSSCYLFFSGESKTWPQAAAYCAEMGASLATITSTSENQVVTALANGYEAWIGLNGFMDYGTRSWMSGTAYQFNEWATGEPDSNYYCALINGNDGQWYDTSCTNTLSAFVCDDSETGQTSITNDSNDDIIWWSDSSTKTWIQAAAYCHSLNTTLVTISSLSDNWHVLHLLSQIGYSAWIGLNGVLDYGSWTWMDGTYYNDENNFTNWAGGEPDSSIYCAFMNPTTGYWYDTFCASTNTDYQTHAIICNSKKEKRLLSQASGQHKDYFLWSTTVSSEKKSWVQAAAYCNSFNSTLATIESLSDNLDALNVIANENEDGLYAAWIGINRFMDYGNWRWMEEGVSTDFTNWESGEPSGSRYCIVMGVYDGYWYDTFCATSSGDYNRNSLLCNPINSNNNNNQSNNTGSTKKDYIVWSTSVSSDRKNWVEAAAYCHSMNTTLATINSWQDNWDAFSVIDEIGKSAWIGINAYMDYGTYTWMSANGYDNNNSFDNWAYDEPSSSIWCGYMNWYNSYWYDLSCTTTSDSYKLYAVLCNPIVESYHSKNYVVWASSSETKNWVEAASYCELQNTTLATIKSWNDNWDAFVIASENGKSAWIGINGYLNYGSWTWMDGYDNGLFDNWASGEPSTSTWCGYIGWASGNWYDGSCTTSNSNYQLYALICNPIYSAPPDHYLVFSGKETEIIYNDDNNNNTNVIGARYSFCYLLISQLNSIDDTPMNEDIAITMEFDSCCQANNFMEYEFKCNLKSSLQFSDSWFNCNFLINNYGNDNNDSSYNILLESDVNSLVNEKTIEFCIEFNSTDMVNIGNGNYNILYQDTDTMTYENESIPMIDVCNCSCHSSDWMQSYVFDETIIYDLNVESHFSTNDTSSFMEESAIELEMSAIYLPNYDDYYLYVTFEKNSDYFDITFKNVNSNKQIEFILDASNGVDSSSIIFNETIEFDLTDCDGNYDSIMFNHFINDTMSQVFVEMILKLPTFGYFGWQNDIYFQLYEMAETILNVWINNIDNSTEQYESFSANIFILNYITAIYTDNSNNDTYNVSLPQCSINFETEMSLYAFEKYYYDNFTLADELTLAYFRFDGWMYAIGAAANIVLCATADNSMYENMGLESKCERDISSICNKAKSENQCFGGCGYGCCCWKFISFDCGCNEKCQTHDYYCSCCGASHWKCYTFLGYEHEPNPSNGDAPLSCSKSATYAIDDTVDNDGFVRGDPHFRTIDSTSFNHDFQGNNAYWYMTDCPITIENNMNNDLLPFYMIGKHYDCNTIASCLQLIHFRIFNPNYTIYITIDNVENYMSIQFGDNLVALCNQLSYLDCDMSGLDVNYSTVDVTYNVYKSNGLYQFDIFMSTIANNNTIVKIRLNRVGTLTSMNIVATDLTNLCKNRNNEVDSYSADYNLKFYFQGTTLRIDTSLSSCVINSAMICGLLGWVNGESCNCMEYLYSTSNDDNYVYISNHENGTTSKIQEWGNTWMVDCNDEIFACNISSIEIIEDEIVSPCKTDALLNLTVYNQCNDIIYNDSNGSFGCCNLDDIDCNELFRECVYDACYCQTNDTNLCYQTIKNNLNDTCSLAVIIPTFTDIPTAYPTIDPTIVPTNYPTNHPTTYPTADPSVNPTINPTHDPTNNPSIDPTFNPTIIPTSELSIDSNDDTTIIPNINTATDTDDDDNGYSENSENDESELSLSSSVRILLICLCSALLIFIIIVAAMCYNKNRQKGVISNVSTQVEIVNVPLPNVTNKQTANNTQFDGEIRNGQTDTHVIFRD